VLTEAFSTMWPNAPHRVLRSAVEDAQRHAGETVAEMRMGDRDVPIPKWHVAPPDASARGNIGAMALYAGESVTHVRRRQPAAEIVAELLAGVENSRLINLHSTDRANV
jgi:hypothetical protein